MELTVGSRLTRRRELLTHESELLLRFAVEPPLGRWSEHPHHVCRNAAALVFSPLKTFDPSNFASRSVRTARFVGVREDSVLAYAKDDGQRATHSVDRQRS
jgi:hypothetical protein